MTTAAEKYLRDHVDASGAIKWPTEDASKVDLAQTLLGMRFVGNCDYWCRHAKDLITNPEPAEPYVRPWNEAAKADRAYRDAFATLTEQQREAVLQLIRNVVEGAVFSSLVTLDQFAHSEVVLELRNRKGELPYSVQAIPGNHGIGIHERWHEWTTDFSDEGVEDSPPNAG